MPACRHTSCPLHAFESGPLLLWRMPIQFAVIVSSIFPGVAFKGKQPPPRVILFSQVFFFGGGRRKIFHWPSDGVAGRAYSTFVMWKAVSCCTSLLSFCFSAVTFGYVCVCVCAITLSHSMGLNLDKNS